jgi:hypothetical protein
VCFEPALIAVIIPAPSYFEKLSYLIGESSVYDEKKRKQNKCTKNWSLVLFLIVNL